MNGRAPITGMKARASLFFKAAAVAAVLLLNPLHSATSGAEEQTLSLSSAVKEALQNNPVIRAERLKVRAKDAAKDAAGYLEDPSIKVELEEIPKDEPLNISPDNTMLTRYTVSQGIPFPGKRSLRERIAIKESAKASFALRLVEVEISAMVKEAYFEYSFLSESIRIIRDIKEVLTLMSRSAETRYATGQASQQDVIRAQLESTLLSNELITLEAEREVSRARLKSLLSRPQDSDLAPPEALPTGRVEIDIDEIAKRAASESPEIRMTESGVESAQLSTDLMRKDYYPDFMVGVAPIQRDGRFESYDLMFQMNIPIWRGKYSGRVEEASAEAEALRARLSYEKNRKAFEIKEAFLRVEAADRTRTLYETSVLPQAELAFESAVKNYQAGRTDLLTLLDSERALKRARIEGLSSVTGYYKSLSALERAAGFAVLPDAWEAVTGKSGGIAVR